MTYTSSVSRKEKLLYLLDQSSNSNRIIGRKKLMKLVFFAEHYDPDEDELVSEPQLDLFDFEIFKYGPFSKKVLDDFDQLKNQNDLFEDSSRMQYLIKVTADGSEKTEDIGENLPEEEKMHLEKISREFSDKSGSELENLSLEMLGIKKREKDRYRGMSISSIIDGATPIEQ